ncbi:hypothetical protein QBC34DRAFT_406555 [Podospora aff. communis PSN243]|uniref:Uncharacterized protein n=1 Tax=Podospora aff. communis PSN243 TaxID=3040156 RepID=A0AAV9GMW6_9PEZI|nr:hypothetical protein QBC34DRAFT_406555 [Podospora aff. communis PSN243]
MDWPAFERPFLSDEDLNFFQFRRSDLPCKLLRHSNLHNSNSGVDNPLPADPLVLHGADPTKPESAQWQNWLGSDALKTPPESEQREITDCHGYQILMSARVPPVQLKPERPSGLWYLPIDGTTWKQIVRQFKVHNVIRKALKRDKSYCTFLSSRSSVESVEMFTAVSSSLWEYNIAISSTHFTKSQLTLAVIYGCNEDQMKKVQRLLEASPGVRAHPFLMVGIFAELQRDRIEALVREEEKELDIMMSQDLKLYHDDVVPTKARGLGWKRGRRIPMFRSHVNRLEEEARGIKCQMEKMVKHMEGVAKREAAKIPALLQREKTETVQEEKKRAHNEAKSLQDFVAKTERFVERFEEICVELDSFMARCRLALDELTFAREVFVAYNASQQTRTSAVVGFVAMLYLPITAMATIFATPVFDFKNDWQDLRLNHLGSSDSDQDSSGDRNLPVVSGYFWWYFLSSALLSLATVIYWNTKRKEREAVPDSNDDEDEADGLHNAETNVAVIDSVPEGETMTSNAPSAMFLSGTDSDRWSWDPRSFFGSKLKPEESPA